MQRSFGYIMLLFLGMGIISCYSQDIPEKPLIKYVTYDSDNNLVHIEWNASTTPDIDSNRIRIVEVDANNIVTGHQLIASLPGNVLSYDFTPPSQPPYPQYYTVVAVKNNEYSNLGGDYHKTVKLDIEFDSCLNRIILNWDSYIGWKNLLIGYTIWQKKGASGSYEILTNKDYKTNSYIITDVELNEDYEYYVEAFHAQQFRSSSNKMKIFTHSPDTPEITIDNISVIDERNASIQFTVSELDEINDFNLLRASDQYTEFTVRATMNDLLDLTSITTDNFPTKGERNYFRIDALNSCGNPVGSSNIVNNILLRGTTDNTNVDLQWTPGEGFKNGISGYKIWRQSTYGEFIEVASLQGQNTSYRGLLPSGEDALSGELIYYVEAIEAGRERGSISNTLTIRTESHLAVPNAFTPNGDGHNDIFKPVMDYIPEYYLMIVFDRTGKKLFETTDPEEGWDGSLNGGVMALQGVYVYHIQFTSFNGTRGNKTGNVSLIIP